MVRFAGRTFLRNPGFTLAIVVTLGLGSVMFGVINAILLRPLVTDTAGRLVVIAWSLLFGLIAGACGAVAATRLLANASSDLLYQTSHTDPIVYTGVVVLLAIAAFAATLHPVRRAIRIDPATALRHE